MANQSNPIATTMVFCTYRNRTTNGWRKSKDYASMRDLLAAMLPYLTKYPNTIVTYQTRTAFF